MMLKAKRSPEDNTGDAVETSVYEGLYDDIGLGETSGRMGTVRKCFVEGRPSPGPLLTIEMECAWNVS